MTDTIMKPCWEKTDEYELWSKALDTELLQCRDEGRDTEKIEGLFREISSLRPSEEKEIMADALFSLIQKLPQKQGYPYCEPDDLELIRKERHPFELRMTKGDVSDKMLGGWYGRICGCLLGKPIEGIRSWDLKKLCQLSGNYPLSRYICKEDVKDGMQDEVKHPLCYLYPSDFGKMPSDDDTNYMIIALEVLKRHGRGFTSEDIAKVWLETQPKNAYCTAERRAFINLVNGFLPPESGKYKNAYREWIGAQIRGDVFGYINPCDPEEAAEMAWRDARISHVKNGIYGEMWVSAMLAAAYGSDDIPGIIRRGLAEIPKDSRLHEAIETVVSGFEEGRSEEECFAGIASRWNENVMHGWCHTISNAEIVASSLLYGGGDYGKSICMAVSQGFDTDCNGATVGSVLGVMLGYEKLPREWTDRINDTLCSTLTGYGTVSVKKMAEETLDFVKQ